jgi:hypothetical protein
MRKPTSALVISVIALFVALGGAGVAATGGNFILGKANSATSTTSLSAPIGGKALQVSNTSTMAGASALGLSVASGHAPLVVSSGAGKAYNLNADKLDGIDSTGFVKGRGTTLANRIVFAPTATKTLLTIPGLGYLSAICLSGDAVWLRGAGNALDEPVAEPFRVGAGRRAAILAVRIGSDQSLCSLLVGIAVPAPRLRS